MHLINTKSLELESFSASKIPNYAILSHTWQEEEVTYDDITCSNALRPAYKRKKGWQKIVGASKKAQEQDFDYLWVDTCCINKASSAELSEAINSMFQWYRSAAICFAYLPDVAYESSYHGKGYANLSASRWFTRGWTLQELIAPRQIEFYGQEWQYIGNKSSLRSKLSSITGIEAEVLSDPTLVYQTSVAQRMSWAARRQTERQEDIAYCLMGLFDVDMPLIYGEGMKAFIRLQEEILKVSEDHSLFAWFVKDTDSNTEQLLETAVTDGGVLALHPAFFMNSSDCVPIRSPHSEMASTPRRIRIEARLMAESQDGALLSLYCIALNRPDEEVCVRLRRDTYKYRRDSPWKLEYMEHRFCPASKLQSILLHRSGRGVGINREYLGSISIGRIEDVRLRYLRIHVKVPNFERIYDDFDLALADLAWTSVKKYFEWDFDFNARTCLLPEPNALRYVSLIFEDLPTRISVFVLFRLAANGPAVVSCRNLTELPYSREDRRDEVALMVLSDFQTHPDELGMFVPRKQYYGDARRGPQVMSKSSQHCTAFYQNVNGQACFAIKITRSTSMDRVAYEIDLNRTPELATPHYMLPELPAEPIGRDQCDPLARLLIDNARKRNKFVDLSIPHGHLLCSCCFGNNHSAIRSIDHSEIHQADGPRDSEFREVAYAAASERRTDFWSHYSQATPPTSASGSTSSLASGVGSAISLSSGPESTEADVQVLGPGSSDGMSLMLTDQDHSRPIHNDQPATVEDE